MRIDKKHKKENNYNEPAHVLEKNKEKAEEKKKSEQYPPKEKTK